MEKSTAVMTAIDGAVMLSGGETAYTLWRSKSHGGEAPSLVVVLMHGFVHSRESMKRLGDAIAERVASLNAAVISYDRFGNGHSAVPLVDYGEFELSSPRHPRAPDWFAPHQSTTHSSFSRPIHVPHTPQCF